jgi:hypothetical protein
MTHAFAHIQQSTSRLCLKESLLHGTVTYRLNVVALWVNDEGAVGVSVIVRSEARCAVVLSAGSNGLTVESIHLRTRLGTPSDSPSWRLGHHMEKGHQ